MVKDAFTWNNCRLGFNNIAEKLDRFFVLGSLINFPFTLEASILLFSGSYHFPILLDIQGEVGPKRSPFKFEKYVAKGRSHPGASKRMVVWGQGLWVWDL